MESLRKENAELKAALEKADFRALESELRTRLAEQDETIAQFTARLAALGQEALVTSRILAPE